MFTDPDDTVTLLGKREDPLAWYARVETTGSDSPKILDIALPKSYEYIRPLQKPEVDRLLKNGWSEERTLFLEVPYIFSFFPFAPAQAGNWIIGVQEKKVFFKVVAFSRGYVSTTSQVALEDTVSHELGHLGESLKAGLRGVLPIGTKDEVTEAELQAEESREHVLTFDKLSRKYGVETVAMALLEEGFLAKRSMATTPVLFGLVMELWLVRYCTAHSDELDAYARILPPPMCGGVWAKTPKYVEEDVTSIYRQFVEEDLPGY